jgi:hypothetical protein
MPALSWSRSRGVDPGWTSFPHRAHTVIDPATSDVVSQRCPPRATQASRRTRLMTGSCASTERNTTDVTVVTKNARSQHDGGWVGANFESTLTPPTLREKNSSSARAMAGPISGSDSGAPCVGCGRSFERRSGPGRPRQWCELCRPRKTAEDRAAYNAARRLAYVPRTPVVRACSECGAETTRRVVCGARRCVDARYRRLHPVEYAAKQARKYRRRVLKSGGEILTRGSGGLLAEPLPTPRGGGES